MAAPLKLGIVISQIVRRETKSFPLIFLMLASNINHCSQKGNVYDNVIKVLRTDMFNINEKNNDINCIFINFY